jgi:type IV pilus biogenesis protein PilP
MFSKSKAYLLTLAVSAAILPGLTCASDAAEDALEVGAYMKSVNESIAKKSAKLRELELLVQIEEKQKALQDIQHTGEPNTSKDSDNPMTPDTLSAMQKAEKEEERRSLPTVKSVEGAAGALQATLLMSDRSTHAVRVGDRLNSGWKVVNIDVNNVTVKKGNESVNLPFGERVYLHPNRPQQASFGADSFAAPPSQVYSGQP